MSVRRSEVEIGGRTLSLSNADKVLYPRDGYTKGDVVAYYRTMAPWILPHLANRPLTLQRYPDGIDGPSFFEKHLPKSLPEWVPRTSLTSPGGHRAETTYMLCNDEATLAFVANLASIVLHLWTSRVPAIEEPDYVFFDLDPGERCTIRTLAAVALELRALLASIGMTALTKTSGGMGLHVVVPLAGGYDYDSAKMFAEAVAARLAAEDAERVTLERSLKRRDPAKVYFDYQQVGRGKTIVSAFSLRARDGAPVSMPLDWSEVEAFARKRSGVPEEVFGAFNLSNARKRIERDGDAWSGKAWKRQKLEPAIAKARKLWA